MRPKGSLKTETELRDGKPRAWQSHTPYNPHKKGSLKVERRWLADTSPSAHTCPFGDEPLPRQAKAA
ncbi:hypothetical protein [Kingella sp. (in: b-proteobacteria)]|uniref:hypothetical protein n=1 Tax=Kingella sp. (in: b-proteobacteria) TaxID=2020713 RepID=UPI0026DCCA2A|nr:hypothetical protein [Kingella sp. (in: b-proteobacteria)]MDO4656439.1 hypothetical protein [Kingella sp. (in: b-proteobacteria)]